MPRSKRWGRMQQPGEHDGKRAEKRAHRELTDNGDDFGFGDMGERATWTQWLAETKLAMIMRLS